MYSTLYNQRRGTIA